MCGGGGGALGRLRVFNKVTVPKAKRKVACVRLRLRHVGYVETLPKIRDKNKNKNQKIKQISNIS